MKLYRHLSRLQSTIYSRREIEVEQLVIHLATATNGQILGRLHFYDGFCYRTLLKKPGFFTCLNGQLVAFETLCGAKKPRSSAKNLVSKLRCKKCPVVNDGSLLGFEEKLTLRDDDIEKIDYRYHYQRADGTLIVRYDNAPHHPELPGFPNHKHTPAGIEPAKPPDLGEALKEIDTYLYPAD